MPSLDALEKVNKKIRDSEYNGDTAKLNDLLTVDFVMRRANGFFANKEEYLKQLASTKYEFLQQEIYRVIFINHEMAFVILTLEAKGTGSATGSFEGKYINTRFFRKHGSSWQLYAWYNYNRSGKVTEPGNIAGTQKKIEERGLPDGMKLQSVLFPSAARTRWHLHPEAQVLRIISGTARVGIRTDVDYVVKDYEAGSEVHIKPGLLHWHGATEDGYMQHIADNRFLLSAYTTYWFNRVSDDEYAITEPADNNIS